MDISTLVILVFAAAAAAFCVWRLLEARIPGAVGPEDADGGNSRPEGAMKAIGAALGAAGRLLPQTAREAGDTRSRLRSGGVHLDVTTWRGICVLSAVAGALLGYLAVYRPIAQSAFGAREVAEVAIALAAGSLAPTAVLALLTRRRKAEIRRALPAAITLLSMAVKAGRPVEVAFRLVAEKTSGPLSEEFLVVDNDINRLQDTTVTALGRMARRCGVEEVSAFCSSLIQAIDQHAALGAVLDRQAALARRKWFAALEERANRIPHLIVIPMVLCFVPCAFIASIAPMMSSITSLFTGGL